MSYYRSEEDIYNEMFLGYTATSIGKESLLYNACMPVCIKLSEAYLALDEVTKQIFAKKAVESGYSSFLDLRVEEMGIKRKESTYALIEITVNGTAKMIFPKDSIVGTSDNRLYITQSDLILDDNGSGKVKVRAEKAGSKYNVTANEINYLPIKYSGIKSITNEKAYFDAYDEETNESLYYRYSLKVQIPATSGNKYHYQNWALEVDGVGSAKVYPLWNGNGTVKVVISSSNYRAASSDLIKTVADHIEENRPIGPTVTVVSVEELPLIISLKLIYDSVSYTLDTIKTNIQNSISQYLKDVALKTDHISIAKVGAIILSTSGVTDYSNLTINGSTINLPIADNQIAVLSGVVCNVT
ncbi:putative phage protein gp47/JayE [Clostridium saccharoperbutylacetonicum]|uniref:Phage-like element PBSX protein XkdT n=1 Tax=Clostridium saccharoperbutylacetonicum N1-4(HMT) TaxID=931276 RepID=M1MYH8_9CLOT|nr:baseplate J/gp47 family protein [Clostridium saccharoperbutylacetonicum]AGF56472.1 phage-like element PBSX protein XkdT [Clostridium saccharoperbutylacetonicum N1-4(HMT)]NRT62781.1 putative phage protein gp47/JayE [Clostridium saccharoperbutylacetonicum]NSB26134.1 putative phage protein gp47/JayE [Clostridium saccharoperbutylacetonicum]NSB45488.1 putative phage protein gp47/JayE [Clostridium saccharoperbutylacetonicum]